MARLPNPMLDYLTQQVLDFAIAPVKGGFWPTSHLDMSDQPLRHTVLDIEAFKLSELDASKLAADPNVTITERANPHATVRGL
ncbi:MAG: hypothetical protein WA885_13665 [Phormidesmis sp.]